MANYSSRSNPYCLLNDLPPLTILVVSQESGLPGGGFRATEDIPRNMLAVFDHDWLQGHTPTPEEFATAVVERPSRPSRGTDVLDTIKSVGEAALGATEQVRSKAIEQYWPTIERLCREQIPAVAFDVARDDQRITDIAHGLYAVLPLPVRLFVREPDFVNFCLENRDRLLSLVNVNADSSRKDSE